MAYVCNIKKLARAQFFPLQTLHNINAIWYITKIDV